MEESTNAGTQDFMYPPHTRAGGDLQRMQDVDDTGRISEHVHVNMRVWFSTEIRGTLCGLRPRGMSCSVERHITAASIALLKAAAGKLPTAGHSEPTRGDSGHESGDHSDIRTTQQVKSAETVCNTGPIAYRRQRQDCLQSRPWKAGASLSATKARSLCSIASRQMLCS